MKTIWAHSARRRPWPWPVARRQWASSSIDSVSGGRSSQGVSIFLLASLGLAFAEARPLLLILSAVSGIGLAYLFTTTMPFVIAWTRRDERQFISALSFSVISLSLTAGSLLGGFLPGVLPGSDLQTYRWTLVAGTGIAALGLVPMFLMGAARQGSGLPDPTAVREAADSGERRRVRRDIGVFVLVGGLMAVGAGMVFPFFNVYLTTLGADATTVGYVYALGGLSAAAVGLSAPLIARQFGSLVGVAVVRLSIVPFYLALIMTPELVACRRDAHRAADERLDGLADRFNLHCRSVASTREDASLWFTVSRMESRVLRGEPCSRSADRECRVPGDLFRSDPLHRAGDDHLRRLLQSASTRALRRAEQRPATLATQPAAVGRCVRRGGAMMTPLCGPRLSRRALVAACGLVLTRSRITRALESNVDALVAAMTAHERAARMFMLPISGTVLSAEDDAWLRALKPGGVILVEVNFGTPQEVRALVAAIHATNPELPPLVALDQEGGIVSRIADDPAPDAPTMGQLPAERSRRWREPAPKRWPSTDST